MCGAVSAAKRAALFDARFAARVYACSRESLKFKRSRAQSPNGRDRRASTLKPNGLLAQALPARAPEKT